MYEHIELSDLPASCMAMVKRLEKFSRNELTARKKAEVANHIEGCRSCRSSLEELSYVSSHMGRGLSAVLLLGGGLGVVVSSNGMTPSMAVVGASTAASGLATGGAATGFSSSGILVKVLLCASALAGVSAIPVAMMMNTAGDVSAVTDGPVVNTEKSAPVATPAPSKKEDPKPAPAPAAEEEDAGTPLVITPPADTQQVPPPVTNNTDDGGGTLPTEDPTPPTTDDDDNDTWTQPTYPTVVTPPENLDSSNPDPDTFE